MTDFKVVDAPGMLSVRVKSYDKDGNEVPDDGQWHSHTLTAQYVLAEFLVDKGLVDGISSIDRDPNLVIMWSQLSIAGQNFVKIAGERWLRSVDRMGTTEAVMVQKLERRWSSFTNASVS